MDFTLEQLRVLDAIDRSGSFAKAGQELFKASSAISYAVKGLEEALGVEIFDRSRRKAVLTAAGQRVLEASREVLGRARTLEALSIEFRGGWEPDLHVIADGILPMRPLTACLRRFAARDVPTRLRLDVEYREGVVDRFEDDRAQIALVLGFAGDGDDAGYETLPLPDLELLLVAAADHPLAAGPSTAEEREGFAELTVRDSSPRFARQAPGSFMGSRTVVHLSDFHSKRLALLDGAGFGWTPRHLVAGDLASGTLVVLQTEGPSCWTYAPRIVTREGEPLGRGGRLFIETLMSSEGEEPAASG